MRLAMVISLLQLLACATLQLQPEERRDDFRSLVTPRRSFRPNSPRRLASRRIRSLIGPDIVPRGNPTLPPPSSILDQLIRFKEEGGITPIATRLDGNVQIYRVNFHLYFKGHLIVKEIKLCPPFWWQETLAKEIRGVRAANQLYGVLFDGERYFILMKDMGEKWTHHSPGGSEATELMRQAEKRYEAIYFVSRNIVHNLRDFTWTQRPDNT